MIREFRVNNFKSFNEEQILSFEATKDLSGENYQVITMPDGTRLLRFAVVYGANASGKSNLIAALDFVRAFLKGKEDVSKDTNLEIAPFKLTENPAIDSSFVLVFYVKGKKYKYSLSINEKCVTLERLEIYNTQKPTKIFERTNVNDRDVISFNGSFNIDSGLQKDFDRYTLSNTSVFNTLHHISRSGIPGLDDVFEYFNQKYDMSIASLHNNEAKKQFVLKLIKEADFNIEDIHVERKKITDSAIKHIIDDNDIPTVLKDRIKNNPYQTRVFFKHYGTNETGQMIHRNFEDSEESAGTRSTVGFSIVLYELMQKGLFLTDDEFEKSFHPDVMKKLIFTFLNERNSLSQMLITTHYDPLMDEIDCGNLRADSFWFTEKGSNGSTELYSLVDFNGINSLSSIRGAYRSGQLGALPRIKY